MVEVLVMAEHMGEGIDLDEAVIAPVPDELPEADILPGGANTVQLGLGLPGVASHHLVDGGALADVLDDEALDLLGLVADDLYLIELGPRLKTMWFMQLT